MAIKKTTRTKATRTKAELTNAFENVSKKVETQEEPDGAAAAAALRRNAEVRQSTQGLSVDTAVQRITSAKLDANRALDTVSEQLIQVTKELEDTRAAVQLEREELEEIHGKEVVASTTKLLVEEHARLQTDFAEDFAEKTKKLLSEQQEMAASFAKEMAEKREEAKKAEVEYKYQLNLTRRKEEDAYARNQQLEMIAIEEGTRTRERNWSEREAALKASEEAHQTLIHKVNNFPMEVDAAVKKAEAIVGNSMKRDFTHQIEVLTAKHEASQQVTNAQLLASRDNNIKLVEQVGALQDQLQKANEHIQKISSDALQSVSGSAALQAVQNFSSQNGQKPAKA